MKQIPKETWNETVFFIDVQNYGALQLNPTQQQQKGKRFVAFSDSIVSICYPLPATPSYPHDTVWLGVKKNENIGAEGAKNRKYWPPHAAKKILAGETEICQFWLKNRQKIENFG